jgi:23S rRNA U2552 (ribose-2'-O)-methylase RlmE/FtsJ
MRDFANVAQLVCLVNLENLNAHFIKQNIPQPDRLQMLNTIAIEQMQLLMSDLARRLEGNKSLLENDIESKKEK